MLRIVSYWRGQVGINRRMGRDILGLLCIKVGKRAMLKIFMRTKIRENGRIICS